MKTAPWKRSSSFSQNLDECKYTDESKSSTTFCNQVLNVEAPVLIQKSLQVISSPVAKLDSLVMSDTYTIDRNLGIYCKLVIYRGESALGDQVMKCDQWEDQHKLKEIQKFKGAPNFRKVLGTDLFGVAQPSEKGTEEIISYLLNTMNYKQIIWINLREEPVVYVNGLPFAPRDKDTLNINLEHLMGIDGLDLENMESQLKADILSYCHAHDGEFKYYYQTVEVKKRTKKYENRIWQKFCKDS